MKNKTIVSVGAVLVSFFIQGFCDIVGISSEYAREAFGWSNTMAGFLPSMVFVWFLFFSVPVGIKMNSWGRKSTVLVGMGVTIVGMFIPLLQASWACLAGYAMLVHLPHHLLQGSADEAREGKPHLRTPHHRRGWRRCRHATDRLGNRPVRLHLCGHLRPNPLRPLSLLLLVEVGQQVDYDK